MNIETKSCNLEIKAIDEAQGIVTFYFSAFGNVDTYGDIVAKGAFTKTIQENITRVKHFLNHDGTKAIGRVLSIGTDESGAYAVCKISQTKDAQDVLTMYKEGIITEHSFGYKVIKSNRDEKSGIRTITELQLWEVSSLTDWGANDKTPVIGIKSTNDTDIIELKAKYLALEQKLNDALTRADSFTPSIEPLNLDLIKQQLKFN